MKKVSVILTTYNSSLNIEKTINSILNQDGVNVNFKIELLIIDDCSKDNTFEILKKFDAKIFSTNLNSGGPNKGRNIGLKNVSGDYICIADHDDIWHSDKILTLLPFLEKVNIVSSGFTILDIKNKKQIERVSKFKDDFIYFKQNLTFLDRLIKSSKGQNTYLGSLIYSSKLKDILFEEHFGMIDYDWGLRLFHENESIEICKSLYDRVVEGENLSLNENYRKIDYYYSLLFIENYQEKYPKEVRKSIKKINSIRAKYYYVTYNMKKSRYFFLKSEFNLKNIFYYFTTFVGAKFVIKKFKVFG